MSMSEVLISMEIISRRGFREWWKRDYEIIAGFCLVLRRNGTVSSR